MADQFGALEFPAQAPNLNAGESVTDPRLDKLGAFLQAALNADLDLAWGTVSAGKKFVEQYFTNDPSDSTFNEKDLPALFVYDPRSAGNQMADDLAEDVSQVTVLWVPATAEQSRRSLRSTGTNGLKKSVERAFYLGRHPAWFDPGDPDPESLTRGSVLMTRSGLCKWPFVRSAQVTPLTIITDGSAPRTYSGFSLTVELSEVTQWDPAAYSPTSAVTTTQTAGALGLEFEIPLP